MTIASEKLTTNPERFRDGVPWARIDAARRRFPNGPTSAEIAALPMFTDSQALRRRLILMGSQNYTDDEVRAAFAEPVVEQRAIEPELKTDEAKENLTRRIEITREKARALLLLFVAVAGAIGFTLWENDILELISQHSLEVALFAIFGIASGMAYTNRHNIIEGYQERRSQRQWQKGEQARVKGVLGEVLSDVDILSQAVAGIETFSWDESELTDTITHWSLIENELKKLTKLSKGLAALTPGKKIAEAMAKDTEKFVYSVIGLVEDDFSAVDQLDHIPDDEADDQLLKAREYRRQERQRDTLRKEQLEAQGWLVKGGKLAKGPELAKLVDFCKEKVVAVQVTRAALATARERFHLEPQSIEDLTSKAVSVLSYGAEAKFTRTMNALDSWLDQLKVAEESEVKPLDLRSELAKWREWLADMKYVEAIRQMQGILDIRSAEMRFLAGFPIDDVEDESIQAELENLRSQAFDAHVGIGGSTIAPETFQAKQWIAFIKYAKAYKAFLSVARENIPSSFERTMGASAVDALSRNLDSLIKEYSDPNKRKPKKEPYRAPSDAGFKKLLAVARACQESSVVTGYLGTNGGEVAVALALIDRLWPKEGARQNPIVVETIEPVIVPEIAAEPAAVGEEVTVIENEGEEEQLVDLFPEYERVPEDILQEQVFIPPTPESPLASDATDDDLRDIDFGELMGIHPDMEIDLGDIDAEPESLETADASNETAGLVDAIVTPDGKFKCPHCAGLPDNPKNKERKKKTFDSIEQLNRHIKDTPIHVEANAPFAKAPAA